MTGNSSWRLALGLKKLREGLDLGAVIFFPYLPAIVWQYFGPLHNKPLAWTLTMIVSVAVWYVYVAFKEPSSKRLTWHFWVIVGLPLLAIYCLRADFPDISFDVLNYHVFESERILRGALYIPGDFFPASAPINPTPDILTGFYRYIFGYRLGTIVNFLALIWIAAILNRMLRDYVRAAWLRSIAVLFILCTEQILFQINEYMVDLLALPLLLEATLIAITPGDSKGYAKRAALLAFLLGVATAFKLANLFFAVPIVMLYVFNFVWVDDLDRRGELLRKLFKITPIATAIFLAPIAPFSIFLYKLTGNPIFPLYNGIFKSPYWPQGVAFDPRWGPWGVLESIAWPVLMFFKPYRLSEFSAYSGRLSIGYLLAPICLIIAKGNRDVRAIAFITLIGAILWSASSGYIRYVLLLELTSGILLIWLVWFIWKKTVSSPRWARLSAQGALCLLLAAQSALALNYVSRWEWSTRETILNRETFFREEYLNLLRDRSLASYLPNSDLALFKNVDVWIETTYKTSAIAALLTPKAPIISVRMPNYFGTNAARQKFSDVLQAAEGKRMFTLTTHENMEEARTALAARGLSMGKAHAVPVYYFSKSFKFEMLLAEVSPSWQNKAAQTQAAEKGLPLSDMAFKARLSVADAPAVMRAGQKYSIRVLLRNDSKVVWPGRQPTWQFQLTVGNRWLTEAGANITNMDGRAALFQDLAPSQTVELPLTVTAPNEAGDYILQLDVIQEGVAWFGDRGSEVLSLKVKVE